MKLQVSNTNAPVWRDITINSELPAKLKNLEEIAHNVWWSWNSEAKSLFHDIDRELWRSTGENPVLLLQKLSFERLQELENDKAMLNRINSVYKTFKEYLSKPMRKDIPSISYFSMEYGLCSALKIYSGGLGVLAGDYIKEASDSCIDLTAVGFLYRYGRVVSRGRKGCARHAQCEHERHQNREQSCFHHSCLLFSMTEFPGAFQTENALICMASANSARRSFPAHAFTCTTQQPPARV